MPQIVLQHNSSDGLYLKNRQAALQKLCDSPFSNAALALLSQWSQIKGAEEKIMKNKGKITAKLTF